jgi:TolA-binding protein
MDNDGILSPGWIAAIYGSAAVLSAAAAMRGILIEQDAWILTGLVAMILTMTTLPICVGLRNRSSDATGHSMDSDRIRTQLKNLNDTLESLNENQILSDDARRVLNRRKERELLCKAIEEDILIEDWDAGLVLVRELAERFGYRAEAEDFREKIDAARSKTMHRHVSDAVAGLDQLISKHKWDQAMHEAARISRVYHDSPQVEGLRHRVEQSKERYKYEIERRFLHAAQEDRIEEAMDLLHEMDHYLSEHEAEQFREVARGVIGKARENLGVQFKLAVNDKAWDKAAGVGQQIIQEFPNSRMASEVRNMIDSIRQRAETISR